MLGDLNKCSLFHASYGEQPFRIDKDEFLEEKTLKFYVRNIERLVRTSPEYKSWIAFVHNVIGTNFSCYHTGEVSGTCSIHLHHHPFTLYDYVLIALESTHKFDTFNIAEEVMAYHYYNYVGFIPLCSTSHEKYHSGILDVPINLVEGNWDGFVKKFGNAIPEHLINKVTTLATVTTDTCDETWYMKERNYVDVNSEESTVIADHTVLDNRYAVKKDWGSNDVDL